MKKCNSISGKLKHKRRCERKRARRKWLSRRNKRKRNRSFEQSKRRSNRGSSDSRSQRERVTIHTPQRLDAIEQSDETIKVCELIRKYRENGGKEIFVDMSSMREFTLSGVIALAVAIKTKPTHSKKIPPSSIEGNLPMNESVASEFIESGFFRNFTIEGQQLPQAKASWISQREKKVGSQKADKLIKFANENNIHMPQEQKNAIWQNLVECMTNTHNHAKGKDGNPSGDGDTEQWVAGVMCREGEAQFTFIDMGVGICKSVQATNYMTMIKNTISGYGPDKLVRDAFDGKIGSSTGRPGRGLGLPRMRRDAQFGYLQNLKIRTGKVEGDIAKMQYRKVKESFNGTIISWSASTNEE